MDPTQMSVPLPALLRLVSTLRSVSHKTEASPSSGGFSLFLPIFTRNVKGNQNTFSQPFPDDTFPSVISPCSAALSPRSVVSLTLNGSKRCGIFFSFWFVCTRFIRLILLLSLPSVLGWQLPLLTAFSCLPPSVPGVQ